MKKLLVGLLLLLAILAAGLVYADLEVRKMAEGRARDKLAEALPQAAEPWVEIDSFPFVGRVLWDGTVTGIRIGATSLRSRGVTLQDLRLEVRGLTIDRDLLLSEQRLAVTDIDRASIRGEINLAELAERFGVPVAVENGRITVTHQGRTYQGRIVVGDHVIRLEIDGLPATVVPLPEHALLPCDPSIEIVGEHLEIACTTTELPPAVAEVLRTG